MKTLDSHLRLILLQKIQADVRLAIALEGQSLSRMLRYSLEDPIQKLKLSGRLPNSAPMSQRAFNQAGKQVTDYWEGRSLKLRWEHSVPFNELVNLLKAVVNDLNGIEKIMDSYYRPTWITEEEDTKLTAAGLQKKMPDGWQLGDSPFARYDQVGIKFREGTLPALLNDPVQQFSIDDAH